jgi:hypothetical protein
MNNGETLKRPGPGELDSHKLGLHFWALALEEEGYARPLAAMLKSKQTRRRTDLARVYWILGAIYTLNKLCGMEWAKAHDPIKISKRKDGAISFSGPRIKLLIPARVAKSK